MKPQKRRRVMHATRLLCGAVFVLLFADPHRVLAFMLAEPFSRLDEVVQNAFFRGACEAITDEYYTVALIKYGVDGTANDAQWSCLQQSSIRTFVSMARDRMRQDRNLMPSIAIRNAMVDQCGPPDFRGVVKPRN